MVNARVSGMVWLPKAEVHPSAMDYFRKNLLIVPRKFGNYGDDVKPTPIKCWSETPDEIGLPRAFWFATSKGHYDYTWDVSFGEPISLESKLRHEGPYAEQAVILDKLLDHTQPVRDSLVDEDLHDDKTVGLAMGGIFKADPGFGKTNVTLELIRRLGVTTVVLVHKEFLLSQWVRRAEKWLPGVKVGVCQGPRCDFEGYDIVVAMLESLALEDGSRYPMSFYDWPGLLVLDEVHRAGAPTWSPVPEMFSAAYRLGLSATPRRKDGADDVFWWHIGPIICEAKTEMPKPMVRMVQISKPFNHPPYLSRQDANDSIVVTLLSKLTARNWKITSETTKALKGAAKRKVMVLSERLEHLRQLEKELMVAVRQDPKLSKAGITTGFYVGEWFTGETTAKLEQGKWPMEGDGREKAIRLIYSSISRRKRYKGKIIKKDNKKAHLVKILGSDINGFMEDDNDGFEGDFDDDKMYETVLEHLSNLDLFRMARWFNIAQKSKEKTRQTTEEEQREAERARVIYATYQMCCIDVDTEIIDSFSGEKTTMRECVDNGCVPQVISGRDRCRSATPVGVGIRGDKECVEIVIGGRGKRSLVLTPDHKVWTQRGWVDAGNLVFHECEPSSVWGDYVATPRLLHVDECPTNIDEDEAWLLGLLSADGSISCPQRGTFGLTTDDDELVVEADRVLRKHGMYLKKERHQHWVTRTDVGRFGPGIKSWLRCELERLDMCKAVHDKKVPSEIMTAPIPVMMAFVAGYMDGDGCVNKRGQMSFSSVSRALLEQVRVLLLRVGIPTKPPVHGGKGCFVVILGRYESTDARRRVPMRLSRKCNVRGTHDERTLGVGDFTMVPPQETARVLEKARGNGFLLKDISLTLGIRPNRLSLKRPLPRDLHNAICEIVGEDYLNDAVAWLPVRSVRGVGIRTVGDFSVPPDKSWVANGIIVHNSEGVDIPALDTVILASPVSDVEQTAGRARRHCYPDENDPMKCEHFCPWRAGECKGKPPPIIADIVDLGYPLCAKRERWRKNWYWNSEFKVVEGQ